MKISRFIHRSALAVVSVLLWGMVNVQGGILTELPTIRINGKVMYYYDAQSGDNIYTIADKLGVSVEEIRANNPSVADGVKPRMRLLFPAGISTNETDDSHGPLTHVVQKGESVYGISHQYGMTVDELLALNPRAAAGLRPGQRLILKATENNPDEATPQASEKETPAASESDADLTLFAQSDDSQSADAAPVDSLAAVEPLDIAVILPFMLDEEKLSHSAKLYTEFYKGFLLAATEANQDGRTPLRIHAFDSAASLDTVQAIMRLPQIQNVELIITPDNQTQIDAIVAGAPQGAMVLNLFSVKDSTYLTNPGMIQANIPRGEMFDRAVEGFLARFDGVTPVFLTRKGGRTDKSEFTDLLKSALSEKGIAYQTIHFDGYLADADLEQFDPQNGKFVFIPNSGNRDEFSRIIHALKAMNGRAVDPDAVLLFGYPEWATFRADQFKDMCDINTTIYSRYSPAEKSAGMLEISHLFSENFGEGLINKQMPVMGVLGYDTGRYVIDAMRRKASTGEFPTDFDGVQTGMRLSLAADGGGLYNSALFLIHYTPGDNVTYELIALNRTLVEYD